MRLPATAPPATIAGAHPSPSANSSAASETAWDPLIGHDANGPVRYCHSGSMATSRKSMGDISAPLDWREASSSSRPDPATCRGASRQHVEVGWKPGA
jgi:hypothetical protein